MSQSYIFHLVPVAYYQAFADPEWYWPEAFPDEGFIHCCYEHQIEDIIERYFKEAKDILAIKIQVDLLVAEVKVEKAPVGQYYPHIYGKINRNAIINDRRVK